MLTLLRNLFRPARNMASVAIRISSLAEIQYQASRGDERPAQLRKRPASWSRKMTAPRIETPPMRSRVVPPFLLTRPASSSSLSGLRLTSLLTSLPPIGVSRWPLRWLPIWLLGWLPI